MAEINSIFENDELYDKLSTADNEKAIREALSGLDVYNEIEELDENALEAGSGGYSRSWESTKIVAVTYYEIKNTEKQEHIVTLKFRKQSVGLNAMPKFSRNL